MRFSCEVGVFAQFVAPQRSRRHFWQTFIQPNVRNGLSSDQIRSLQVPGFWCKFGRLLCMRLNGAQRSRSKLSRHHTSDQPHASSARRLGVSACSPPHGIQVGVLKPSFPWRGNTFIPKSALFLAYRFTSSKMILPLYLNASHLPAHPNPVVCGRREMLLRAASEQYSCHQLQGGFTQPSSSPKSISSNSAFQSVIRPTPCYVSTASNSACSPKAELPVPPPIFADSVPSPNKVIWPNSAAA